MHALIALDGSATSQRAPQLAGELLAGETSTVTPISVLPRHCVYGALGPVALEVHDLAERTEAPGRAIDAAAAVLRAADVGPDIVPALPIGGLAELILEAAARDEAGLIVLGARGLNVVERFRLGSVSHKVVAHVHCPVLITRQKAAAAR